MSESKGVKDHARFVVQTAGYATVVGIVPVVYASLCDWMNYSTLRWERNERLALFDVTYPDPLRVPNGGTSTTTEERLKLLVANTPYFFLCYATFFPVAFYFYLEHFPKKAVGVALLSYFVTLYVGYGVAEVGLLYLANPVYAAVYLVIAFRCTLPTGSKLPKILLFQVGTLLLGVVWVMVVLPNLPINDEYFEVAYYCLILPFVREVSRILATKCAWYLTSDAEINGEESSDNILNRVVAWVFVGWLQVFWALYYRLAITNMQSFWKSLFVVTWQAFLEIFLRLTILQRDEAIGRIKKRAFKLKRRQTKVLDWSNVQNLKSIVSVARVKGSQADIENAQAVFYSMILLTDMMAEYVGIASSGFLLAFWSSKPLIRPFNWYVDNALGDQAPEFGWLCFTTALQVGFEIMVDLICMRYEKRTDPSAIWASTNKRVFGILFMMSSWYGSISAVSFFTMGDNFNACQGMDMCHCVKNGLQEGGVREAYCHLIYPNGTWDTDPVVLGVLHISNLSNIKS